MKNKNIKFLLYFSITIFVISFAMVTLKNSYAFYENETKYNIISSKVKERKNYNIEIYVQGNDLEYTLSPTIPTGSYKISSKSSCDDEKSIINYKNGILEIDSLEEYQSCSIYFDLV